MSSLSSSCRQVDCCVHPSHCIRHRCRCRRDADFVVFVLFGADFGSAGAIVDCFGSAPLHDFPDHVSRRPGEWVLMVQF